MSLAYLSFLLSLHSGEVFFTPFVIALFSITLSVALGTGLFMALPASILVSNSRLSYWVREKPGFAGACFGLFSAATWLPFFFSIHAVAVGFIGLSRSLEWTLIIPASITGAIMGLFFYRYIRLYLSSPRKRKTK